jgi:cysteine desulfurase/selenocysteine lyase
LPAGDPTSIQPSVAPAAAVAPEVDTGAVFSAPLRLENLEPYADFGVPSLSIATLPPIDEKAISSVQVGTPYWLVPHTGGETASSPSSVDVDAFQIDSISDFGMRHSAGGEFDPQAIRREFPILQERVHGHRLVWLDNAATTQKPQVVIDRLSYFYEHENSNVHRASHTLAARATDAYEGARATVRRFLNAPSVSEIVFVRGTTEGINLVAQSWGRRNVSEGDEIVITWLEHHANIVPWQQLCSATGARLRVAPVDDRGQVILEEYEKLLGPKTRLVAFSQVSNALGTITPAREMIELAHRHGAKVLVDGAQAVSHLSVDVQLLDCDFYIFSGHKVFAPTGIGVVFGKRQLLEAMPPWQGGGNMIEDVTFELTRYQGPPARFEAGTGSIADAIGLGTAIDWLSRLGVANVARYEVSSLLDKEGIAERSGHHCAQPILRRFGLEATVRASLAPYNVCEDIDALVAALYRLQATQSS